MSVFVKHLYVEVWIRSDEIKDEVLRVSNPVFPADVPAFYEELVKAMLGSEVDISFIVFIVGRVLSVWFHLRIVSLAKPNSRKF